MAHRLIEIVIPQSEAGKARGILEDQPNLGLWQDGISEDRVWIRSLTAAEHTESVMDEMEKNFSHTEGFRLVLLPVEAILPRPEAVAEKAEAPAPAETAPGKQEPRIYERISREELYAELTEGAGVSTAYVAMVILSAVVAAVGLLRDNMPILVGAMVIAPLLGPHIALAFATTLADAQMARAAVKAGAFGFLIAICFAVAVGLLFTVEPSAREIASRTRVHPSDIILALAAGIAGSLSFTTGAPSSLIGVMVAVALMPPIVTAGLLLGAAHFQPALGSLLLLLTNVICVNLAGVVTFLALGIRPRTWWEATQAKRYTQKAIVIWSALLAVLAVAIYLSRGGA